MTRNFLNSINVELINFNGENLAENAFRFNRFGSDHYHIPGLYTDKTFEEFYNELINGKTFPKYVMNTRFDFEIRGISRICLAQLTRDAAIFCSESHGLRPLDFDIVLPSSLTCDEDIMNEYYEAMKHLKKAYVIACEKEVPYPESRYLGPHAQTISVCASYTLGDFIRCCRSRTNNSFCDELNLVYRFMLNALIVNIELINDERSRKIWEHYINKNNCIDDSYYTRTKVFNGDFLPSIAVNKEVEEPAINDWRHSGWKTDLETINTFYPNLLTEKERFEIDYWTDYEGMGGTLPSTYNPDNPRAAKNAIKEMPYYKETK